MAQVFGPLHPCGREEDPDEDPDSQLWTGAALVIITIWGVIQQMGNLSLLFSVTLSGKKTLIVPLYY